MSAGIAAILILGAPLAAATATLPSGEVAVGQSTVEPGYNDANGHLAYVLTPNHAPENANSHAWAPFYIVAYPAGSTVGTLNCMGVPGNCPDHDGLIAGAATTIMPSVYGTDPTTVLGHDHLFAVPGGGGDFNIAWEVYLILFTNTSYINNHLTTLAEIDAALATGEVAEFNSGIVFHCSVVSQAVYNLGTPVSG